MTTSSRPTGVMPDQTTGSRGTSGWSTLWGRGGVLAILAVLALMAWPFGVTGPMVAAAEPISASSSAVSATPLASASATGTSSSTAPEDAGTASEGTAKRPGRTKTTMALIFTVILAALAAIFVYVRSRRDNIPE